MSQHGILKAAEAFKTLQTLRGELLKMGTKKGKVNLQDIRLAQMLETGKDAMKVTFTKETHKVED